MTEIKKRNNNLDSVPIPKITDTPGSTVDEIDEKMDEFTKKLNKVQSLDAEIAIADLPGTDDELHEIEISVEEAAKDEIKKLRIFSRMQRGFWVAVFFLAVIEQLALILSLILLNSLWMHTNEEYMVVIYFVVLLFDVLFLSSLVISWFCAKIWAIHKNGQNLNVYNIMW